MVRLRQHFGLLEYHNVVIVIGLRGRERWLGSLVDRGAGQEGGFAQSKWVIRRCHQFQCMPVATETEVERFFLKDPFKTFRVCCARGGRETLDSGGGDVPCSCFTVTPSGCSHPIT